MKSLALWGILAVLAVVIALCFVRPQAMLAPGPVVAAHAAIAEDCFACHAPLHGAQAARCIACHAPARIGRLTTRGIALPANGSAFHQQLRQADCMACHSDHAGPALAGHGPAGFRHELLPPATMARCGTCHRAPAGARALLHKAVAATNCSDCHQISGWKPANFRHEALLPAQRDQCATCHTPPAGVLHRRFGGVNCAQCHSTTAWEPSSFAHDRFFRLEGTHAAACDTCHVDGNLARFTCYGCHAHQPAQTLALHREEGIVSIANCARCHRGASGEDGEGGEGGDRREGQSRARGDHDD